jgi:hypothetical protein
LDWDRRAEKVRQVGLELLVAVEPVARPAGIDPCVDGGRHDDIILLERQAVIIGG